MHIEVDFYKFKDENNQNVRQKGLGFRNKDMKTIMNTHEFQDLSSTM